MGAGVDWRLRMQAIANRKSRAHPSSRAVGLSAARRSPFAAPALAFLIAAALATQAGCRRKGKDDSQEPACDPAKAEWSLHVVVQPSPSMNLDDQGQPLDTVLRIYELNSDLNTAALDFEEVWSKGGAVFGDALVNETEVTIFADRDFIHDIKPDPKTTHVLAAAIFRKPVGNTWYRVYKVPTDHGEALCAQPGVEIPDPCFFVVLDANQVDGGPTPPATFDRSRLTMRCAPPGLPKAKKAPPKNKDEKKDKKSRFEKLKSGAKDGQDAAKKGSDGVNKGTGAVDSAKAAPDAAKKAATPPPAPTLPK
jgi:type VI secretion system VasD/TssJ family lipoprotein